MVSIVIPCYNSEAFIDATINSALHQTYSHTEIICVDNGSTDATVAIIRKWSQEYPHKIRLVVDNRPGANFARNKGLAISQGDWIQFLDSDDLLLPKKIAHQVNLVKGLTEVGFVAGSYTKCYRQSANIDHKLNRIDPWLALPQVKLGITSSNLFRRLSLLSIGGWKEDLQSSQEYDLMFRLLKADFKVVHDDRSLTIVNERENSITTSNLLDNCLRRMHHLQEIAEYQLSNDFPIEHLRTTNQCIFEEIRRVYKISPHMALDKYKAYFNKRPILQPSESTNELYIKIFNVLNFKVTQLINKIYHSISPKSEG